MKMKKHGGHHHHGQEDGVRGGQQNRKFMDGLKVARNQKKSASHVADRVCTTQINDDIDDDHDGCDHDHCDNYDNDDHDNNWWR